MKSETRGRRLCCRPWALWPRVTAQQQPEAKPARGGCAPTFLQKQEAGQQAVWPTAFI